MKPYTYISSNKVKLSLKKNLSLPKVKFCYNCCEKIKKKMSSILDFQVISVSLLVLQKVIKAFGTYELNSLLFRNKPPTQRRG